MREYRSKDSPGRRAESLKLPGDFARRSERERRMLRERWARGEGLESPTLARLQDEVSPEAQSAHAPRYRRSRGAAALEDALAKLPPVEAADDAARPQSGDDDASLTTEGAVDRASVTPDVTDGESRDVVTERGSQEQDTHPVDAMPGVRAPRIALEAAPEPLEAEQDAEEMTPVASSASSTAETPAEARESYRATNSNEAREEEYADDSLTPSYEDAEADKTLSSERELVQPVGAKSETYTEFSADADFGPELRESDDYIDSFSAYDDRYAHYYDDYEAGETRPPSEDVDPEDPYGHYDPYKNQDPYGHYDPYENRDPYEDYDPYQSSDEGVEPEAVSEADFLTEFDVGSESDEELDDSTEERGPVIRRVASSIDEDGYVIPELKEASNIYLTLIASEDAPVSRVDFSTPVTEAAVSLVTSRLPRITEEMYEDAEAREATGAFEPVAGERAELSEAEANSGATKKRSLVDRLKNVDHLTASTLVLMIGNILSKLTGQLRQVLYPHVFVEKYLTDAYVQGFLIPDFIYELLIGGSIQAAIVPTLAEALGTEEEKKTWSSISKFISFVSLVMLGFLLLAELVTPQILRPFVKPENIELTSRMARALFPQTFFMMCAAMVIGLINAHRKFLKTTFGPAIYNTLFVLSIFIFGAPNEDALVRVGLGVSFSALVYFLFQLTMGRKEVKPFKFGIDLKDKGFQHLLILVVPILFSSSISHINTMVLHGFTKELEAGAATALNQTNSVWLLPYGIFSVAIGQAMLPTLSSLIGRKQEKGASDVLSMSLRRMLYFAIPSALSFYLLREDLMQGIFIWRFEGYTEQIEVTRLAAELLRFYCLSILFQSIIYIYNYAFYAMKITYLPLINGVISLVLTLVVGSYTTRPDVLGAAGLSVSYALSGFVTALMLIILYRVRFPHLAPRFFSRDWGIFFLKLIPMIVISCSALLAMERYIVLDLTARKLPQLLWLGARFVVVFGLWYLLSKLLRLDLGTKKGKEAVAAI